MLSGMVVALCQLVLSAHNLCKQIGPRSGPREYQARSGSILFDTQMVFLKEVPLIMMLPTLSTEKQHHDLIKCFLTLLYKIPAARF